MCKIGCGFFDFIIFLNDNTKIFYQDKKFSEDRNMTINLIIKIDIYIYIVYYSKKLLHFFCKKNEFLLQ